MAKKREFTTTQTWDDYQRGLDYLRRRNYFDDMDKANRFYIGDQWYGLQAGDETPPMFNFIRPVVKYKASVVGQNDLEIVYNPMDATGMERELYDATCNALNQLAAQTWERLKLSRVLWDDIKDSFVMGSKYRYFYVEDGQRIEMTEISPTNIFFGDEQNANIQEQPYIIISQRRPVQEVRDEAKRLGVKKEELDNIQPDSDTDNELGDDADEEVNQGNARYGKCTTLVRFERIDGVLYVSRATRTVEYQTPTAIEGMTLYPIAGMLIERIKGMARGMGEVLPLIPNQISVNKQLYRIEQSLKQSAFPRLVYSRAIVENPEDIEAVGKPLSIENANAGDIRNYISYLSATPMSSDAYSFLDRVINVTRDLAGAGDAATGAVDPTKASGTAILAVQRSAELPVTEAVEAYIQYLEDIALIWYDLWGTYAVNGLQITQFETERGAEGSVTIPSAELQSMKIHVRIDVSPSAPFDKLAQEQSFENLLAAGHITFEEYVALLSDSSAMPKQKLVDLLKERERKLEEQAQAQTAPEVQGMLPGPDASAMPDMAGLPPEMSAPGVPTGQAMPTGQIPTDGFPAMG